ncbi:transposase [Singulisphaera sp. GP187]|uniref:transposase n=1 Tax=Singulisphaera sp. GP187 TaxID=1882752 RepID=UPI0039658996
MRTHHYPSDVTDEQWALIEPHLPPAPLGGRPRKTDLRDVVDAHLLHPPHRLPVAIPPCGLPAQDHRLAGFQ